MGFARGASPRGATPRRQGGRGPREEIQGEEEEGVPDANLDVASGRMLRELFVAELDVVVECARATPASHLSLRSAPPSKTPM